MRDWRKNQQQDRSELELLDLKTESKLQKTPLSQRRRLLSRRRRLRDQQHTNRHARRQQFTIARRIFTGKLLGFLREIDTLLMKRKSGNFLQFWMVLVLTKFSVYFRVFFEFIYPRANRASLLKNLTDFSFRTGSLRKAGHEKVNLQLLSLSRGKYPPYFD